jgi:hypothetical protein
LPTALIAAFRPGLSPPAVSIPMFFATLAMVIRPASLPERLAADRGRRRLRTGKFPLDFKLA